MDKWLLASENPNSAYFVNKGKKKRRKGWSLERVAKQMVHA
jgi:hypothetical protein